MTARKVTPTDLLDKLLSANPVSQETPALRLHHVPLRKIDDNPFQTRMANDRDHVLNLAKSIVSLRPSLPDTNGLQQVPIGRIVRFGDGASVNPADYDNPITLRRHLADPEMVVQLAFGHSRRLAFVALATGPASVFPDLAGAEQLAFDGAEFDPADYADMPVILMPIFDEEMWRHAVTENGQRRDISAIEEAHAIQRAVGELGMTIEAAGRTLNKSRSAASNLLRLLDLPAEYRDAILNGVMTEKHGRTLLTMRDAWHLVRMDPESAGAMSTRELESALQRVVMACKPLPWQRRQFATVVWNDNISKRDHDPLPFRVDWLPETEDYLILGACNTCQFMRKFTMDDGGDRCAQPSPDRGVASCLDRKLELWQQQDRAAQQATAEAALQRSGSAAAPAHTPVAAADSGAAERPVTFFAKRDYSAPASLIEKGACSAERCECFVLAYNQHAREDHVRPDPEGAPNMCYGCTSTQRLARRRQELEHGDVGAKRKSIKADNEACERRLLDVLAKFEPHELWRNREFMTAMVAAGTVDHASSVAAHTDVGFIQQAIWLHVAGATCRRYSNMVVDGESRHWDPMAVEKWIQRMAHGASPLLESIVLDGQVDIEAES